jgi:hypothetical protein
MFRRTLSQFAKLLGKSTCPPIRTSARTSRFRPGLEALEAREVPANFTWTGALSTNALDAANWSSLEEPGGLPGEDDHLYFNGPSLVTIGDPDEPYEGGVSTSGSVVNCDNLQSLGSGFAGVHIGAGYTGTVTTGEALTFGVFDLANGAISQSASAFDLTVTGTFNWTGGVLNSSAALANFTLSGATATIAPTGGASVALGSSIDFSNGSTTTLKEGTLNVTKDGIELHVRTLSTIKVDPGANAYTVIGGLFSTHLQIKPNAKVTVLTGSFNAKSRVTNEGTLTLSKDTAAEFAGSAASTTAYLQKTGGKTFLTGGTSLVTPLSKNIAIEGGILATISDSPDGWDGNVSASILTNRLIVTGGDIHIAYTAPLRRTFGQLQVIGEVHWLGGTFHCVVPEDGSGDSWHSTKLTIGGTAALSVTVIDAEWAPTTPTSGRVWDVLIADNPIVRAAGTPSVDGQVWELVVQGNGTILAVKAK